MRKNSLLIHRVMEYGKNGEKKISSFHISSYVTTKEKRQIVENIRKLVNVGTGVDPETLTYAIRYIGNNPIVFALNGQQMAHGFEIWAECKTVRKTYGLKNLKKSMLLLYPMVSEKKALEIEKAGEVSNEQ